LIRPASLRSGHHPHGIVDAILSEHCTDIIGIRSWVKKGEKGITIFAPMLMKQKDPAATSQPIKKPEDVFRLVGFRTAYVFDISQTEGRPLPELAKTTGANKEYGEKLKALVAKQGISVEYDAGIAPAQGMSSGGRIRLMPGMTPAEEFSVLAHELAHEMIHHRPDATRPLQVVRETQAEAVAFVVCRGVGLETNTAAADYIALYNGDKKTLAESLAVIQQTSTKILDEILPEERSRAQPAQTHMSADRQTSPQPEHLNHAQGAQPCRDQPPTPESPKPVTWDR
jgi:hypothetical protein